MTKHTRVTILVLLLGACGGDNRGNGGDDDGADGGVLPALTCTRDADCESACAEEARCDTATHECVFTGAAPDGFPCAAASECFAGACIAIACGDGIAQSGEACDDGNADDEDGCDSACEFSCTTDRDCAPADACSTAVCADHACVAGPPVDCSDGDACTADTCGATGCAHADIDDDGDAFGPGDACGGDCNDHAASAHPGQTGWFAVKLPGAPAASDFDYDCDGVETKRYPSLSTCENYHSAFHCNLGSTSGWWQTVPACGVTAEFGIDCSWDGVTCTTIRESRTQECR